MPLLFPFVFMQIVVFTKGFTTNDARYCVLMVLESGNNQTLHEMWSGPVFNSISSDLLNETDLSKAIYKGEFRTNEDALRNYTRTSIVMVLCNAVGDILWWIQFNSSNADSDMTSWMNHKRIIDWTYTSPYNDVSINTSSSPYQFYVGPDSNHDKAWLAVLDKKNDQGNPLLLFSPEFTEPMDLFQTPSNPTVANLGCWFHDQFITTVYQKESPTMTVDICINECLSRTEGYALLEVYVGYTVGNAVIPSGLVPDGITYVSNSISNIYLSEPQNTMGHKCHCGNLKSSASSVDSNINRCHLACKGDTSQNCGGESNWFATYNKLPQKELTPTDFTTLRSTESVVITALPISNKIATGILNPSYYSGYISAIKITPFHLNFTLKYNPTNCQFNESKTYLDMEATSKPIVKVFQSGGIDNLTLTPARCAWIVIHDDDNITEAVTLTLYYPSESSVFLADFLALIGVYSEYDHGNTLPKTTASETLTMSSSTSTSKYTTLKSTTDDSSVSSTSSSSEATWITFDPPVGPTNNTGVVICSPDNMHCCVNCCNTTNNNNITEEELQEKLDKIRTILLVNKHNLSSAIRKRVSATDERVSSKGIGGAGAVILCALVISIVAIDINSLVKMLLQKK